MRKVFYLTKNGLSDKKIVILEDSAPIIKNAAAELANAVTQITGVKILVEPVQKIEPSSGCIVLATFDGLNFLNGIFEDDIKFIGDSDGFAVREFSGSIYIAAAQEKGVFYGAHSFIESNADIIWPRGGKIYSAVYKTQKTVRVKRVNYYEKSPFALRGWNTCGVGVEGEKKDSGTMLCFAKNKNNCKFGIYDQSYRDIGIDSFGLFIEDLHNLDALMDKHPEFFMTDTSGAPKKRLDESYINYYNSGAADAFAERIIDFIEKTPSLKKSVMYLGIPDDPYFYMTENGVVLSEREFTADDGVKVSPNEPCYKSTVYYNYLNRVIDKVCQKYPECKFLTLAYLYGESAPKTKIHDNLYIAAAPIHTNDHYSYLEAEGERTKSIIDNLLQWARLTKRLCVYNYWQCHRGGIYSRPSAKVVQKNLLWYQKIGIYGLIPEGKVDKYDAQGVDNFFDMNELYYWQMNRLFWNPDLNLDDMTKKFCRLAYGKAAADMQRYYKLLQYGWDKMPGYIFYAAGGDMYIGQFIIKAGIADKVLKCLNSALKKSLTETEEKRIRPIAEIMNREIAKYSKTSDERAEAAYSGAGIDVILSDKSLDLDNNPASVWNNAKKLTALKNYDTFEDYPKEAEFCAAMLWDEEYFYIGFRVYDDRLNGGKEQEFNRFGQPIVMREDGSQLESYTETYIGGNILNMCKYYGYFSGFMQDRDSSFYVNSGAPVRTEKPSGYREKFFVRYDDAPEKRYYFHVQAIPFKALETTADDARIYGSFVYYSNRYGRAGWKGNGLWSKENFSEFYLLKD